MRAIVALLSLALVMFGESGAHAVTLVPVANGLSSPLFLTHAHDGLLYIVERGGVMKRLDRASGAATVFLDIRGAVLAAGNEQGLLGLAFHPRYRANGRLFVFHTRRDDGALVIAEHRRIAGEPARADPAGIPLLVIPHPFANHNGGMLAFGPDGYLYIGTGDGGGANDPGNHAQNRDSLLGKILRIDVDGAAMPYAIPRDNPFVAVPGRDEIFAFGLRNPWRFSFDRATGALWVADVGQGAREEVNAPIVAGGNYGWRVFEGNVCTGNDSALCDPSRFIAPLFEYGHGAGRCSITGGHVYRGPRGALLHGTYVYADFCTGEILGWDGASQFVLAHVPMAIASFGEDEVGELYVVDLGGTVHRLAADSGPASLAIEYFHAGFGHYFTTASEHEIAALDRGDIAGWSRTGESFAVALEASASDDRVPVCRFFSGDAFAPKSSHFYTPWASECDSVRRDAQWQLEGEVFALVLPDAGGACRAGTTPLYRVYNNGSGGAPNHRYTTSLVTRATMVAQGWLPEGLGALGVIGCVSG